MTKSMKRQKSYNARRSMMGMIVKSRDRDSLARNGLPLPIIFCNADEQLLNQAIPINIPLAKKLSGTKPGKRTMRLEQFFQQVLAELPSNPVIRDFDVMFNPEYEIDVLRIMCSAAKSRPFSIVWNGRYEDGKLYYAEEGYRDYKVFDINQYDVTCVI